MRCKSQARHTKGEDATLTLSPGFCVAIVSLLSEACNDFKWTLKCAVLPGQPVPYLLCLRFGEVSLSRLQRGNVGLDPVQDVSDTSRRWTSSACKEELHSTAGSSQPKNTFMP